MKNKGGSKKGNDQEKEKNNSSGGSLFRKVSMGRHLHGFRPPALQTLGTENKKKKKNKKKIPFERFSF